MILIWSCWSMFVTEISYEPPPDRENSDRPSFEVTVPAAVEAMNFDINGKSTTIRLSLAQWSPGATLGISSPIGEDIQILELRAESNSGNSIQTDAWEIVAGDPVAGNGSYLQLRPSIATPPSQVTLTLSNGETTDSGYYHFVRTSRLDVVGTSGTPDAANGVVSVETGPYSVERFFTGGVSRPGDSEGSITRYEVASKQVLGANSSAIPVPAVSIDLVDVEKNRSRNSNLLVLGAVLGVAGGTFIEILLTTAHLGVLWSRSTRDTAG